MPNQPINSELNAKNTCSDCDHYNGSDNTCRRSSPRPDVMHVGTNQEWRAIWPVIEDASVDWCSEYGLSIRVCIECGDSVERCGCINYCTNCGEMPIFDTCPNCGKRRNEQDSVEVPLFSRGAIVGGDTTVESHE